MKVVEILDVRPRLDATAPNVLSLGADLCSYGKYLVQQRDSNLLTIDWDCSLRLNTCKCLQSGAYRRMWYRHSVVVQSALGDTEVYPQ